MLKNLLSNIANRTVTFNIDWGMFALLKLLAEYEFTHVLDIGSGSGEHTRLLEYFGKNVISVDLSGDADYVGNFLDIEFGRKFGAIWCSHVLEHQRNVGIFLDRIFDVLDDDGVLAITVPTHPRGRLIAGHLTSWSIPLLCYNLIMAGFDCRLAKILCTFELSLIVRKQPAKHGELRHASTYSRDGGTEFSHITQFFPFEAKQGIEIPETQSMNWGSPTDYELPLPPGRGRTQIDVRSKLLASYPNLVPKIGFRS